MCKSKADGGYRCSIHVAEERSKIDAEFRQEVIGTMEPDFQNVPDTRPDDGRPRHQEWMNRGRYYATSSPQAKAAERKVRAAEARLSELGQEPWAPEKDKFPEEWAEHAKAVKHQNEIIKQVTAENYADYVVSASPDYNRAALEFLSTDKGRALGKKMAENIVAAKVPSINEAKINPLAARHRELVGVHNQVEDYKAKYAAGNRLGIGATAKIGDETIVPRVAGLKHVRQGTSEFELSKSGVYIEGSELTQKMLYKKGLEAGTFVGAQQKIAYAEIFDDFAHRSGI